MTAALKPIRVTITNFQSIESLDLEVSGFTCITGKSNIGKSAIVRAVAGALLNSPVGPHVRKGSKFCTVTLQSEDWSLRWEKGSGVSRYFVPADVEKPLDKVGAGQIDPVAKMGFQSVRLGRDVTHPWYATQFEPLFLLTETGATVTDFISEVSRLQVLQDAITISVRAKKKAQDEVKVRSSDLESLRDRASKVAEVPEVDRIVKELEEQAESIREYERRVGLAEGLYRQLESGKSTILAVEAVERVRVPEADLGTDLDRLKRMGSAQRALSEGAKKIIAIKGIGAAKVPDMPADEMDKLRRAARFSGLPEMRAGLERLKDAEKASIPDSSEVSDGIERLRKASNLLSRITALAASVKSLSKLGPVPAAIDPSSIRELARMSDYWTKMESARSEIAQMEARLEASGKELDRIRAELDKIPSCPTCGRVVQGADPHAAHPTNGSAHAHA